MKRKDFIHELVRIAELNSQVVNVKEIPLFCCKQFKINQRTPQTHNQTNIPNKYSNPNKQSVLIINDSRVSRGNSAFQRKQDNIKARPARRILTTPSSISLAATDDRQKKLEHDISLHSSPGKSKQGSSLQQQSSPVQRSSYTQPCDPLQPAPSNCKSNTSRILYVSSLCSKKQGDNSLRLRPGSAAKYQSVKEGSAKEGVGERRNPLSLKRQLMNSYKKPFEPPPKLTAKSYLIYQIKPNPEENSLIFSFNSKNSQEVASLTKIMTCLLTLELCQRFSTDKQSEEVVIGKMESSLGGTSANLEPGQIYTISQLLYGLMLPSGNDASVALAVWAGRKLLAREKEEALQDRNKSTVQLGRCMSSQGDCEAEPKKSECYSRFLKEMNAKARSFKMMKTNYSNSHGLINQNNKSSAYDIALLTSHAMQNPTFREIVQTKEYKTTIRVSPAKTREETISSDDQIDNPNFFNPETNKPTSVPSSQNNTKKELGKMDVEWKNTHKLLHLKPKEYIGIKTGFTTMAGPCLCSCVSAHNREFVIVVLSCGKMSLRFKQTELLRKWLYKREGLGKRKKEEEEEEKTNSELSEREKEREVD